MLGIGSAYGFEKNTAGKVRDIVLSQFHPNPDLTDWTFSHLDDELFLIPYMKNGFWKCRVVPIGAGADKSITAEIIKMAASSYGMPQEFQAQISVNNNKKILTYRESDRFSLRCIKEEKKFYYLTGGYRVTRAIALVGNPAAGKSCNFISVQSTLTMNRLAALFPNVKIKAQEKDIGKIPKLEKTHLNDTSAFVFEVSSGKKHGVSHDIVLFDIAGEVTATERFIQGYSSEEYSNSDREIFDKLVTMLNRMDLIFMVKKGRDYLAGTEVPCKKDRLRHLFRLLNKNIPTVMIVTELDILEARCRQSAQNIADNAPAPLINDTVLMKDSPVFSLVKDGEQLRMHVALSSALLESLDPVYKGIPTFFVSNAVELPGDIMDFTLSKNVELPIAYALSMAGVEIKEGDD